MGRFLYLIPSMTEKSINYRETAIIAGVFIAVIASILSFISVRDSNLNPHYRDYGRPVQSVKV